MGGVFFTLAVLLASVIVGGLQYQYNPTELVLDPSRSDGRFTRVPAKPETRLIRALIFAAIPILVSLLFMALVFTNGVK